MNEVFFQKTGRLISHPSRVRRVLRFLGILALDFMKFSLSKQYCIMADDLAEKVFNVICNTGGFVELSSLLTDSSPLKHIKSKLEAENWLIQHAGGRFVVVKDINDEVIGVRVELKKKICKHYLERGSCKVAKGKCRFWHICKSHLEGDCYGKCRHNRSHDFYDNDNEQKTKDLKIAKHPNGRLKNLVAWSLPQVCLLYLRNDCISDKCPYLHVCSNVVRELPCTSCGLSHSLTDFHNKNILKQYDLVPHKRMKTTFVCTSILVMKEQRSFIGEKHRSQNALASPANKLSDSATLSNSTEDCPQRGTTGQESSSCGANDCHVNSNSEEISGGTDIDAKKNETKPDQPKSKKQQIQKNIPKYVNDLASSVTASASSKKNPGFLNIEEEEEEGHSDSSSEDNKSEWKSFLSAKGSQSIHQTFESKPSNKLVDNDPKFLEAKAVSKEDPKVDPCTSKGAAKASTIRNDPPVLPAYSFENDFVKKWLLGVDDCSSDSTQSLEHPQTKEKPVRRKRKSSISSSCSSAPDPQKCTPFKKAVFDCILKEYNGTVPFRIISKRKDLFTEGCGDIATWFKARKESFLLKQSKDGTIIEISAYCRRVQLCFNQEHCSKKECPFLHACRNYIAGFCRFGSGCQRNHTFKNDENRKFISKLKLTGLSEEQLRKVVQLSIPQVCLDYNEGCCVLGESCGKIHICKDMIRKRCADQGICGLEHEEALLTAQATAVLNRYGLKIKDGHVHSVVRTLLVCERKHSVDLNLTVKETISTATSMTSSNSAVESKGEKKQSGSSPFSLTSVSVAKTTSTVSTTSPSTMTKGATGSKNSSYQRSGPSPLNGIASCNPSDHIVNVIESIRKEIFPSGNSGEPSERKVFECLCKEYNCSVTFSVISKRTDLFPAGFKDVESWFRKRKGSFLILENPDGKITEVSAFAAKARLCFSYNNAHYGTCMNDNCSFLHICRDYITDSCANGATCPRNHQFCNEKDKALLSQINLEKFTDEQLRRLVLSSSPLICVEYNDGICDRGDACPRIHMCSNHLKKCSREGRGCLLEHESAMTTDHTRAILERFRIDHLKPGSVKKAILLFDDLAQSRETGHVHSDKPDTPICSDFLLGKCKKGMKCSGHHCSLPYHWQYRVEDEGVWKSFTETDNEKVEKLYCDAMMDDCSATGFQLSFESDGFLFFDEEYAVNFLFENKMMFVQKDFEVLADIRRLYTEPSIDNLGNPLASTWIWYWKDENGIWLAYGSDYLGNDLQRPIEDAFSSTTNCFKFKIAEQDYALYFREMRQENLRYGTTRQVRRRPAEFRSSADVREIRRSSRKGKTSATVSSTGKPSNWASMPVNMQYTRVALSNVTAEYKEVERLFRSSIQKRVVIRRIERVQNSFMWEKYQRKKENMLAIKRGSHSLNEKRLFHGTSPDAVEAICKQNFDWRLNGKNATVYGEGSYFAVNASYSDAYAKKDANSFQFMFLAKVLVGSYTKGKSSYRRPPPKQPSNPSSDLFDSCVDDQYSPTIYVVFDADQFYPEYIIEYSDESSRNSGARGAPSSAQTPSYSRAAPSRSSVNPTSSYYSSSSGASSGFGSASNSSFGAPHRSTAMSYSSGTASSHSSTYSSHTSSTGTSRNYSSSTNTSGVPHHRSTPSSSSTSKSSKDKCLVM